MGLLDREYYRDEEGGPVSNWLRQGLCTKIIFALNVLFFVIQIASQDLAKKSPFTDLLALVGDSVMRGEIWRLITYAFLHPIDSLLPVLFNLCVLWVVGREVEERMGRGRYVAFYLMATLLSGLALVAAAKFGLNRTTLETTRIMGATAPITALLVWLTLDSPRLQLQFFYALPAPIWALLLVAVGFDLVGLIWPERDVADGQRLTLVGHLAAGLFAAGAHLAMRPPRRLIPRRPAQTKRERHDLRVYRGEPHSSAEDSDQTETVPTPTREADELLEAQLDAVLAKVANQGQSSLTSAEREILQRASEVYRKRRG
jgi:rhomboid family protein